MKAFPRKSKFIKTLNFQCIDLTCFARENTVARPRATIANSTWLWLQIQYSPSDN